LAGAASAHGATAARSGGIVCGWRIDDVYLDPYKSA
jgi:hypothetical protein